MVLSLELSRAYVDFLRSLPELKDASRKEVREILDQRFQAILDSLPVESSTVALAEANAA